MTEYIYDPIAATVREYLMSVQDAPVHGTAPEKKPARFIQLSPVGGVESVVSQRPMVTFICWDETDARSARFAETVIAHIRGCRSLGGLPVYGIRTIGLPVPRPDPESGRPRYQFTLEIQVRGKPFEAP